jgi:hypothetical protein
MKRITILISIAAAILLSLPTSAATVLFYNCDESMTGPGVAGEPVQPGPGAAEGVPDLSGNGYNMWGWCSANGTDNNSPVFSDDVISGRGLSLSMHGNLDGYTTNATINAWSPVTWTIQCSVKIDNLNGWYTIIGRSGSQTGTGDADFYLQKNDTNDQFRLNFLSTGGERYILDSGQTVVANQWYRLAVTSDGLTLRMYIDSLDGNGFQLANSLDMLEVPENNALVASNIVWTFGRGWWGGNNGDYLPGYMDDIRFSDKALTPEELADFQNKLAAHDPNPTPQNPDGSVGTLVGSQAQVTLGFTAGQDPNDVRGHPFNPDIAAHYIYLSYSAADPNMNPVPEAVVLQESTPDPYVAYHMTRLLDGGAVYYWQVEEAMATDTGFLPAGDPNNIVGPVWSFTTIAATPSILTGPKNAVADMSGNAVISVTGSVTATSYEWYKAGDPDVKLEDGGIYSGTTTNTLTFTGAALADEGQYYAIAYNGLTPSTPSPKAYLWTSRLAGYWKLDGDMTDSVTEVVSGAPAHDGFMTISTTVAGAGDPNYVGDGNGLVGDAMAFFGDGDYMSVPNSDFFNFMPNGFTASFWYRSHERVGWRVPLSKLDAGQAGWLFGTDHNPASETPPPNFSFITESPWYRLNGQSTPNVGDGQWHMFTVTYDPATDLMRLFTNGDEDAQLSANLANAPLPATLLSVGGREGESAINGAIDELKIYTYAKTPTEVAEMYLDYGLADYICVNPDGSDFAKYDLNNDCRINLADFALMASKWAECQRYPIESCLWLPDVE